MQTNVRLIDANALIEELRSYGYDETSNAVFSVESAPTVETTDDVWARLPDWSILQKRPHHYVATEDGREYFNAFSPLEAVKKLASSINSK